MDLVITMDALQKSSTNARSPYLESPQESTSSYAIAEIAMYRANAIFEALNIELDDYQEEFEKIREEVFDKYYGSVGQDS